MNFVRMAKRGRAGRGRAIFSVGIGTFLLLLLAVKADAEMPLATNLWSFPLVTSYPYNYSQSTPALAADGTIYLGTFDGTFFAVTPAGKEKWRFKAGREIKSSPAIADDGTIYFGSRDRAFYALTPAGKLKWQFATGAWVDASPALAKTGVIYFGSWDKNFYALNPDGTLKWKLAVGAIVDSSPAIAADGTIYFGAHDKKLYALNADGTVRWKFTASDVINSSPALGADGDVYFNSVDGVFYRLTADGQERWHYRIGSPAEGSPVLADNGNIFLAAGTNVVILSPTGTKIWSWPAPDRMEETPLATQGTVCFSAPWRQLWARQLDGAELWRGQFLENLSTSPVINDQGTVYFCCRIYLIALRPPVPQLPAKSSWPMFRANARHTGRVGND